MWIFCIVQFDLMISRLPCQSTMILAQLKRSQVGHSILSFILGSPFFSEPTRVNDLRRLYSNFDNLYRRHVEKAKFDVVTAPEFRSLKHRLTFVLHHLNERPQLGSRKRTELIQALLSVDDPCHAGEVLLKFDKDKEPVKSSWLPTARGVIRWFKGTNESPRKEERKITSNVSDSDFLRELKGMQDKDLAVPIHEATALAHTHLSSLIGVTVNKMTHQVLQMQQEGCKRRVRHEIETEERRALDRELVNFIRDVNRNSAGRRSS
jgi:hypothetical protein